MCHLIFLLPVAGLPLFWFLPLGYALSVNGGLWLTSGFLYWLVRRAMRKPIQDGFQSLVGTQAEVVARPTSDDSTRYLVRTQGELWSAYSTDTLEVRGQVNIIAVKGINLVVERMENSSHSSKEDETKPAVSESNDNRQPCH